MTINITLTPAEHAYILHLMGVSEGSYSTIRPGQSISGVEALSLRDRIMEAGNDCD